MSEPIEMMDAPDLLAALRRRGGIWLVHAVSLSRARAQLSAPDLVVWVPEAESSDRTNEDAARGYAVQQAARIVESLGPDGAHVIFVRYPGRVAFGSDRNLFAGEVILHDPVALEGLGDWPERTRGDARRFYRFDQPRRFDAHLDGRDLRAALDPLVASFAEGIPAAVLLTADRREHLSHAVLGVPAWPTFTLASWLLLPETELREMEALVGGAGDRDAPTVDPRRVAGLLSVLRRPALVHHLVRATADAWTPTHVAFGTGTVSDKDRAKLRRRIYEANLRSLAPLAAWLAEALMHHTEALEALAIDADASMARSALLRAGTPAVSAWANAVKGALATLPAREHERRRAGSAGAFRALGPLSKTFLAWSRSRPRPPNLVGDEGIWARATFLADGGLPADLLSAWLDPKH